MNYIWQVYGSQPLNRVDLIKEIRVNTSNKDESETLFYLFSKGYKYATVTKQTLNNDGHVIAEQTTRFNESADI